MRAQQRHEVLADKAEGLFGDLSAVLADLREVVVSYEYDATTGRYDSYFSDQDETWTPRFSVLMAHEAQQCENEVRFGYESSLEHCEHLTMTRRRIDSLLITILRDMGWGQAKLKVLEEGLRDRADLIHARRMAIVDYAEALQERDDAIEMARSVGHYSEACTLLQSKCDELTRKIIEVSDQFDQHPAVDA